MKTFITSILLCAVTPIFSAGYIKDFDYQLTDIAFKGLRKDFKYRRRLDYKLARDLISQVLSEI